MIDQTKIVNKMNLKTTLKLMEILWNLQCWSFDNQWEDSCGSYKTLADRIRFKYVWARWCYVYSNMWWKVIIRVKSTTTFHLTLMMTSAQVVETSVTIAHNSPSQDYTHLDDQTTLLHVTPGFKPFTVLIKHREGVWIGGLYVYLLLLAFALPLSSLSIMS